MNFLRRFWRILGGRSAGSRGESVELPWPPESWEPLSRYLLSKREFDRAKLAVKASAFVPGPDGSKSVFRILGLSEAGVWELGQRRVVGPGRRLHARADLSVQAVYDAGTTIRADAPPSRHSDLAGWPPDESARLLAATELADSAELLLNPAVYT